MDRSGPKEPIWTEEDRIGVYGLKCKEMNQIDRHRPNWTEWIEWDQIGPKQTEWTEFDLSGPKQTERQKCYIDVTQQKYNNNKCYA